MTATSPPPLTHHADATTAHLASTHVEAEGAMALESAAVTGRPLVGLTVLAAWITVGLVIAVVVSRRGHDLAPLVAIGMLFGPLLAAYAASTLARHERAIRPTVVSPGVDMGGDADVLVVVLDEPARAADAVPLVRSIWPRLHRVVLARPVTFETTEESDEVASDAKREAAAALSEAALFLPDVDPRMVLLPGRPDRAVSDYVTENGIDYLVAVGDTESQAALCRHGSIRGRTVLITTLIGDPPPDDR